MGTVAQSSSGGALGAQMKLAREKNCVVAGGASWSMGSDGGRKILHFRRRGGGKKHCSSESECKEILVVAM